MKTPIEQRVLTVTDYMVSHNATVRATAEWYGVGKSTIHKDVSERIERINPELAKAVRKILEYNKAERHIRGGLATREKYRRQRRRFQAGRGNGAKNSDRAE